VEPKILSHIHEVPKVIGRWNPHPAQDKLKEARNSSMEDFWFDGPFNSKQLL
jgi:hypothetical protein